MLSAVSHMSLRKRPACPDGDQTPPGRASRADLTRAGLARSLLALGNKPKPARSWTGTGVTRGQHTELYHKLKALPILQVAVTVNTNVSDSKVTLRARHAALVRWQKEGKLQSTEDASEGVDREVANLLPAAGAARAWRVGEGVLRNT